MQDNLVAELTLDEIDAVSGAGLFGSLLGSALQGAVDISNGLLNSVAPLGQALNNTVPGYAIVHQAGDKLIADLQGVAKGVGDALGGTYNAVNPGHYEQEWKSA
ncbi:hypothetical protein [Pseudomonas sp. 5P_3.1_Bac2]|uniref:hypothetical protein n=1 Tax=Pseudomonas sp. 5P_3.1_Bac2 TaxID=2971617 RepID=UPI0021C576D0|nr:hypothetical protein [Pseudomonas sp. 5P_3.1_Bac2]MCU1719161.1 hypothetical protein [Pseudomonas sp. 5P_3.1_Bac2]